MVYFCPAACHVSLNASSHVPQDYFTYEKGLGQSSNGRGVSDENQQKILQWLKDNP